MTGAITKIASLEGRDTRRWMLIAFTAGIVFAAVFLAQTVFPGSSLPGLKNAPAPAVPGTHDALSPPAVPAYVRLA
jgi:hypothetical protein